MCAKISFLVLLSPISNTGKETFYFSNIASAPNKFVPENGIGKCGWKMELEFLEYGMRNIGNWIGNIGKWNWKMELFEIVQLKTKLNAIIGLSHHHTHHT